VITVLLFAFLSQQVTTTIVVNANSGIAFTASIDQNTINIDGLPAITNYQMNICTDTAASICPFAVNLGKPTPDTTNTITITGQFLWAQLAPNTNYYATVVAIGEGGVSVPSNIVGPFAVVPIPRGVNTLVIKK
jgi:hypothetical protein